MRIKYLAGLLLLFFHLPDLIANEAAFLLHIEKLFLEENFDDLIEQIDYFQTNNPCCNISEELTLFKAKSLVQTGKDPSSLPFVNQLELKGMQAYCLYCEEKFEEAENLFRELAEMETGHPSAPKWLLWAAKSAELASKEEKHIKQYLRQVFETYPQSKEAEEAYFSYYNPQEYCKNPKAYKHLKQFPQKFPESPWKMNAYYLLGLLAQQNCFTPEGILFQKKTLFNAIDYFQKAETAYSKDPQISQELLYFRVLLEKALTFLDIAEESKETKQKFYLKQAENGCKTLLEKIDSSSPLYEETLYNLAQIFQKQNQLIHAAATFDQIITFHRSIESATGYYLALAHLGKSYCCNPEQALEELSKAESANRDRILSTDQKLEIWILQSLNHQKLGQFHEAMTLLSKVVNDQSVSKKRLEAMFKRAEIYEMQNRPELARKQLESLAKLEGTWAFRAKTKLEKFYAE